MFTCDYKCNRRPGHRPAFKPCARSVLRFWPTIGYALAASSHTPAQRQSRQRVAFQGRFMRPYRARGADRPLLHQVPGRPGHRGPFRAGRLVCTGARVRPHGGVWPPPHAWPDRFSEAALTQACYFFSSFSARKRKGWQPVKFRTATAKQLRKQWSTRAFCPTTLMCNPLRRADDVGQRLRQCY